MDKKSANFKHINSIFSNMTEDEVIGYEDFEEIKKPWVVRYASKFKNLLIILSLVLVFFILGVVAWKFLNADWTINLSAFTFSDLLSLIMAIFAVSLSVAFYFKATETSNNFYDNVYKFNQDVHKILGRIESGFGERLKHMDKNYSTISDRMKNLTAERNETKEKVKEEEEDVETVKFERDKIINQLIDEANMEAGEKELIREKLAKKEDELIAATSQLKRYQKKLNGLENKLRHQEFKNTKSNKNRLTKGNEEEIIQQILGTLASRFNPEYLRDAKNYSSFHNSFNKIKSSFPEIIFDYMFEVGWIDENKNLTDIGFDEIRFYANKYFV